MHIHFRCYEKEIVRISFTCDNGYRLSVDCNGSSAVITSLCPVVYETPECAVVTSSSSFGGCSVSSSTSESSVCTCNVAAVRELEGSGSDYSAFDLVSYAEMRFYTFDSKYASVEVLAVPPAETPQTILVLGSIIFIGAICFVASLARFSVRHHLFGFKKIKKVTPKDFYAAATKISEQLGQFRTTGLLEVLVNHHTYTSPILSLAADFSIKSRVFKILLVVSTLSTALCAQALLFQLLLGISVSCDSFEMRDGEICKAQIDGFSNGGNACYWDESTLTCLSKTDAVPVSLSTILNIAIFSGLVLAFFGRAVKVRRLN